MLPFWWLHTVLLSSDEHRLSDYSIGPEAKLNLVIRPAGERTGASGTAASGSSSSTHGGVWQMVSTILARHFSPADAAKVHEQLIKVLIKCVIIGSKHWKFIKAKSLLVHFKMWIFSAEQHHFQQLETENVWLKTWSRSPVLNRPNLGETGSASFEACFIP